MSGWYSEERVQRMIAQTVAPLRQRIAELESQIARLKKNSSNSSKPPSCDIVKPPKPAVPAGGKRKIGGHRAPRRQHRC
jgi:transposase